MAVILTGKATLRRTGIGLNFLLMMTIHLFYPKNTYITPTQAVL